MLFRYFITLLGSILETANLFEPQNGHTNVDILAKDLASTYSLQSMQKTVNILLYKRTLYASRTNLLGSLLEGIPASMSTYFSASLVSSLIVAEILILISFLDIFLINSLSVSISKSLLNSSLRVSSYIGESLYCLASSMMIFLSIVASFFIIPNLLATCVNLYLKSGSVSLNIREIKSSKS